MNVPIICLIYPSWIVRMCFHCLFLATSVELTNWIDFWTMLHKWIVILFFCTICLKKPLVRTVGILMLDLKAFINSNLLHRGYFYVSLLIIYVFWISLHHVILRNIKPPILIKIIYNICNYTLCNATLGEFAFGNCENV